MRIVFLSNYYPPHALGGYELWCQEVGDALTARGHNVTIITSRAPGAKPAIDGDGRVHRSLYLELEGGLLHTIGRLLWTRKRREEHNVAYLHSLIQSIQPDVAVMWGMWNVPRSVPAALEQSMPKRVAYYFCDYWPTLPSAYVQRWQETARHGSLHMAKQWLGRWFKASLAQTQPTLAFEHPLCVSKAVQRELIQHEIPVEHAKILYGGIDISLFQVDERRTRPKSSLVRFVFLGRMVPDKGLHTVLDALERLPALIRSSIAVDIFGQGDPLYEADLRRRVDQLELESQVVFRGYVPYAEIPTILQGYDALVFPSIWQEPFARTVLEAMAAGLVVIGSLAGGTGEILVDGKTGLTFPPGDADALAAQLHRLVSDSTLLQRLAKQGQACVTKHYTLQRMVDDFEAALESVRH